MTNTYHLVPEPVTGYFLNPKKGYFSVLVPEERTNIFRNPSFETNTNFAAAFGGSAIARSTTLARRGIYSLRVTPTAALNDGLVYSETDPVATAGNYAYSADVWAYPGVPIRMSTQIGGVIKYINTVGKGRWERISIVIYHPAIGEVASVIIRKNNSFSTRPFYVDGIQAEKGDYPTTYVDGDQVGYKADLLDYYWLGTPHHSYSVRVGKCRSGGRSVSLKDLGMDVLSIVGLGMADPENDIMPYGSIDGGEYHDTHAPSRQFTLTGAIFGKTPGDVQRKRKNIIAAIKSDVVIPKQLLVLRYEFNDGCENEGLILDIPCVYLEGFGGQFDNLHQERVALTFTQPWPYLLEDGSDSALLTDDRFSLDSDAWVLRKANGFWDYYGSVTYLGGAASIYSIIQSNHYGGLFFGGQFDSVAAGVSQFMFFFDLSSRTITQYGVWANDIIRTLFETPNGNIYMGGEFTTIGGNPFAHLAYMDTGGVPQDIAGGVDDDVLTVAVASNGDVFVGGLFLNAGTGGGAVAASYIAMYDVSAAAWTNITPGGDADAQVETIKIGTDGKVYVGGLFVNINGLVANHAAVYDPVAATWDTLGDGFTGGRVRDMCFGLDGRLYACGSFTAPGPYVAVFNGANWERMGNGLFATGIGTSILYKITCGPDGLIYVAGDFRVPGPFYGRNCEFAIWNGSTWGYLDAAPPIQADLENCDGLAICVTNANEIAISFDFSTADLPSQFFWGGQPIDVVNEGSAIAHPTLKCSIANGQHAQLYIRNMATGDELRMETQMPDGGNFWIDMTPGNLRAFSNYNPPVQHTLYDGSSLATFKLAPGVNRLIVFADRTYTGATSITGLFWRNNFWSSDDSIL